MLQSSDIQGYAVAFIVNFTYIRLIDIKFSVVG